MTAAVPAATHEQSTSRPAVPPSADEDPTRRGPWPKVIVGVTLLGILAVGLYIRLRHIQYGLPYVYNYDEAQHFTNRAVRMFGGDFDPRYYQNPSGFTYLMYAGLRLWFAVLNVHLTFPPLSNQFRVDPTPIWTFARVVTAILAILGVGGTFWVARRFFSARVGLVAAALLAFAFLSVTYSRIAVTDVGTFLPIVVAMWAILRV